MCVRVVSYGAGSVAASALLNDRSNPFAQLRYGNTAIR